jgi:4-alpha-glucanotransferase
MAEALSRAGQRHWQVLPIGPTGYGDSPYQLFSAFAGNPLLVNLDALVTMGLLRREELAGAPPQGERADYGAAQGYRLPLLARAASRFSASEGARAADFAAFCVEHRGWLEDYALFMALKEEHNWAPWYRWEAPLRDRRPEALWLAGERLAERLHYHRFVQWQFFTQWRALRERVQAVGVELIGDMPIFVAHDSVEVWTGREQFLLREDGSLRVQAGVPPDYFSATGQLWGNPLYDWDRMRQDGFVFWRARVRHALKLYDWVRIDHFRGFAAHWEVPGDARTAAGGRWVQAPGEALFSALLADLGREGLKLIAEDLGIITADVEQLRDRFGFPGMRVLQFSFGDGEPEKVRPYAWPRNLCAYTSTHDNDTLVGWYRSGGEAHGPQDRVEQRNFLAYIGRSEAEIEAEGVHWAGIRQVLASVAQMVIIPVQDVLGLGGEGRMNRPGCAEGNWGFRLRPGQLDERALLKLRRLSEIYGRCRR